MSWLKNLDSSVLEYVYNLKKEDSDFSFFPVQKLLTKNGEKLNLGFSCYALKIFKLIDYIDKLSESKIDNWAEYGPNTHGNTTLHNKIFIPIISFTYKRMIKTKNNCTFITKKLKFYIPGILVFILYYHFLYHRQN